MIRIIRSLISSVWRAIGADPEVKKLLARHPLVFRFVKNRLTHDETFGIHLTLGTIIVFLCVYFFFGIVHDLIGEDSIIDGDTTILNLFQLARDPVLDSLLVFVTYMGSWFAILGGTCALVLYCWLIRRRHYVIAFLSSLIVSEIAVLAITQLFEHVRPPLMNVGIQTQGFDVTGGQLFAAISFYGLCGYVAYRLCKTGWQKFFIFLGTGIFCILLGTSRMYLGLQWPADVLASSASAFAWLAILITVLEIRRAAHDWEEAPARGSEYVRERSAELLVVLWLVSILVFFVTHPFSSDQIPEPQETVRLQDFPQSLFGLLPRYSETLFGTPTEPINLIVIGSEEQLDAAFRRAGWDKCDELSVQTLTRAGIASILDKEYYSAPGAPTFWNTRPNDFAYAKLTPARTVRERHHIHFWKTTFLTETGEHIWLGTAHFDKGIKLKTPFIIPAHRIDPAVDVERNEVVRDLQESGLVGEVREFSIVDPVLGKNGVGDQFFTDGKSTVVFLKSN